MTTWFLFHVFTLVFGDWLTNGSSLCIPTICSVKEGMRLRRDLGMDLGGKRGLNLEEEEGIEGRNNRGINQTKSRPILMLSI